MKVLNLEISEKQYGFTCLDFNGLFFIQLSIQNLFFGNQKKSVFLSIRKVKLGFY